MACIIDKNIEISVVDIQGNTTRVPGTYLDLSQYDAYDEVCAILPDQETLLFFNFDFLEYNLQILNMTESTSTFDANTPSIGQNLMTISFATNKDILALISQGDQDDYTVNRVEIYNISNIHHPGLINSTEELNYINTITLSSDNKILFVLSGRTNINLSLYDMSNLPMIEHLSSISIKSNSFQWLQFIKVSVDENTAIVNMLPDRYFVLDISDKTSPIIAGSIIVEDSSINENTISSSYGYSAAILQNSKSIVATNNQTNLQIIKSPPYAVVTTPDTIRLGEMTSSTLIPLKKNSNEKYNIFNEDYRFVTMSLYSIAISLSSSQETITYQSLPNWITLDKPNQMLYFTPVSQQLLGPHRIYTVVSTKILQEELNSLNTSDTTDLMSTLISSGYLDNQGYITSNYDLVQPLILPSKYSKDDEIMIHDLLRSHYIQTVIPIYIQSSLDVQADSRPLSISTLSGSPLSVILQIDNSSNDTSTLHQNCKFVKNVDLMAASTIQDMSITLEGQLLEVNGALQQIIINLDDETQKCPGSITVNDGLNPIQNKLCPDLSDYITINHALRLNSDISLQAQINDDLAVHTGYFFSIMLDQAAFLDDGLTYKLVGDPSMTWLTLSDLFLSGTPPEKIWPPQQIQVWKRQYDFDVVASNEFKSTTVPLSIEVNISFLYFLKLVGQIITLIGLWVYLPRIFNILGKNIYRYPKDFIILPGKEITDLHIFPTAFIRAELEESRFIIKELKKSIANELGRKSLEKTELVQYFTDSGSRNINKDKIIKKINDTVISSAIEGKHQPKTYMEGTDLEKNIIAHLVINEIILSQLDSKQEKQTKEVFERLKPKWISLIEEVDSTSLQFSISQTKLDHGLKALGLNSSNIIRSEREKSHSLTDDSSMIEDSSLSSDSPARKYKEAKTNDLTSNRSNSISNMKPLDVELLSRDETRKSKLSSTKVNLDLLSGALAAYAFRRQHFNIEVTKVNVRMMEKQESSLRCLRGAKQFLKLDLKPVFINSNINVGYGIMYNTTGGVLRVSEASYNDLIDRTLIIQISTRRNRILRELWFYAIKNTKKETDLTGFAMNKAHSVVL